MKTVVTAMLFVVVGLTSGCSATSVVKRDYRGMQALQINCSGLGSSWGKCYDKAHQSCRSAGYKVLAKTSDIKEDPEDGFLGWNPGMASRTMFVRCNSQG